MRFPSRSALLATAATAATLAGVACAHDTSDVINLSKDSFKSVVDPEPLILVEFFAPWCGHCKALAPHYEESATALLKESPPIKIAKVDCTVEEDLCASQDIQGYPTLKVFRNGTPAEYTGPRKADGIISYMKKQALPSLSKVSAAELADFKTKDRVVAVAYLPEQSSHLSTFSKVADKHRDAYVFGHVADVEAAKAAGVTPPAVVLYRSFDEPEIKYTGPIDDEEGLEDFLKAQSVPLVDEVGPENFMTYAEAGIPLAYYFTEVNGANKDADLKAIRETAQKYRGKVNFVWIDADKFVNHAKSLNLAGESWPAFAIQDIQGGQKFPLEKLGSDAGKAIASFVEDFVGGKLVASIKSEPIQEQTGPVHVLVADEFDKIVYDDKKDVLVEFYAPWCGHCKKLAPTWDTLGERYASIKDKITIAKMDATTNDIPPSAGFQVQSFPTIKFKPAGGREWLDFNGDRTIEGFVEFISLNAKNDVKVDPSAVNSTAAKTEAEQHEKPKHEEL